MSDSSVHSPSLRAWSGSPIDQTAGPPLASGNFGQSPEFRDLLTALMVSFGLQGQQSEGVNLNSMLAPLMLTLVEQLTAQQVETEPKETLQSSPEPKGMPIEGRLTQNSRPGHVALDFGAPVGTPVHTTMDGRVVYAGWNHEGYGNLVIVENGPFRTYYAHLSEIPVQVGQLVRAGELVGLSGNTGNSTGPHLHYEIRKNNQQINPTQFTLR